MSTVVTRTSTPERYRDPFIDVARTLSIVVVVLGHWIMPVLRDTGDQLVVGNALATQGWWLLTWPAQVLPVFFFAGGAAQHHSFVASTDTRRWLSARLARLALPTLPLLAVWLVLPRVLRGCGLPSQPVAAAAGVAGQPLWFLAVYVLVVALVPVAHTAHRRWGLAVPVVLGGAALGVDTLRLHGVPFVGYLNEILVWSAIAQLGLAYADGSLTRRSALPLAVGGFGGATVAVLFGHYPASMVGLPGQLSNMAPATACLLCVGVGQVGVLLALRDRIASLAQRATLRALGSRAMTIYVWHLPAMLVVAGVTVVGLHYATPTPGSVGWLVATPLWIVTIAFVLSLPVKAFGRLDGVRPAGRELGGVRLCAAVAVLCAGFAGISIAGFATPIVAAVAATAVVVGIVLALPGAVGELGWRVIAVLLDALFS